MDTVLFSVLCRRFDNITRNMQHTLVRSSRSGVISNGHDCSCCILTSADELLSVADTIPIHVMSGADEMSRTMRAFHSDLQPGDAFLHNSPYHGCTHAADLSVLVPVFDDAGLHRFTVLAKSHQADIGNAEPTTYMATARDLYEEGALIFPAVQLQRDYRMIEDIVRLGRVRIRAPDQWYGDLLALVGSARAGEASLRALGREIGWDALAAFAPRWLEYAHAQMCSAIAALPASRVEGHSCHDPFPGTPPDGVSVKAVVDIDPLAAKISVDLGDNLDCLPCGLNLSEASARSAALIGVFNSLATHVPANAGSLRCIDVKLRAGCVVGIPQPTTSCSVATTNLADRVVNAVQLALSKLGPHFGMAEAGAIEGPVGAVISGQDSRRGEHRYINQLALAGTAGGASPGEDGWLTLGNACTAGMWTMDSVEVDELDYPIQVKERRLVTDSEGAGRTRGAPACQVSLEATIDAVHLMWACDGTINAARGARGGGAGAAAAQWMQTDDGTLEPLPGVASLCLQPGQRVVARTTAGGGYGCPRTRAPEAVCEDVREGLVSVQRARTVYAVVCDRTGTLDLPGTSALRSAIEAEKPPG